MKRNFQFLLILVLLYCSVMSGCNAKDHNIPTEQTPTTEFTVPIQTLAPTTTPTEVATIPTEAPTVPTTEPTIPDRPFATQYPYLEPIPAEACIFKSADTASEFVRTIGADGTFTITEEVRDTYGNLWGRLKSGIGWVNLSNPYCHGAQLPPITISRAGNAVLNSDHHMAVVDTEYARAISFVPHETVTDLRIIFTNAGEIVRTVYTMDQLEVGKPLVAHLSYEGDFYGYLFYYTDANGIEHANSIYESLRDGSLLVSY